MSRDNPSRMLVERLWREVFLVHPVRHTVIGYHEKIVSVTREMMMDYYQRRYSPERTSIVVCGAIKADVAAVMIGKRLEDWTRGNLSERSLPVEPEASGLRQCDTFFNDPLARLGLGFQSPSIADPQVAAVNVLTGILGQSQSSRLIQRLVLERELALSLGSFNYSPYFCGMIGFFAICTPDKTSALESALREELRLVINGEISAKEVEREVLQQSTSYLRMLRSNSGLANSLGSTIMAFGNHQAAGLYYDRLNSVDVASVCSAAAALLPENRMSIVRQHPEQKQKTVSVATHKKPVYPIKTEKLSKGVRLVTHPKKQLPLIDICVTIPGGVILEKAANSGISVLLATMLASSNKRWNEAELALFIDENALDLNIAGGRNSLVIQINCRTDHFDAAMELLQSLMTEPKFNEKELKREKTNMLEGLKSRSLSPVRVARDQAAAEIYGTHPYSRPSVGTEKGIRNLKVEDLYHFYYSCLIPGSVVFGIAGDFNKKQAKAKFEEIIRTLNWSSGNIEALMPTLPKFKKNRRSKTIELPREQSVALLALPGCDNYGVERCAFDILESALNGLSSKLFKSIREDAGLAYSTGVAASSGIHPGMVALYAVTSNKGMAKAMTLLEHELQRMRTKGLTAAEYRAAVRSAAFAYERILEKQDTLIFHATLSEYYGNSSRLALELPDIYRQLTRKQVNDIIKSYFDFPGIVAINVLSIQK